MSISNPQLPEVECSRGAPMGRRESVGDLKKCRCFRLRFVDGCYDEGGAYWGSPANVYCAENEDTRIFCRAGNRNAAKAAFKKRHADISFVN